jgi:hypothetical protein
MSSHFSGSPLTSNCLISSAAGEPPGSRVRIAGRPASSKDRNRRRDCTPLPEPSTPSMTIMRLDWELFTFVLLPFEFTFADSTGSV